MGIYCVFCKTGFEDGVEESLKQFGYAAMLPKLKKWERANGRLVEKQRCLLPGYVFFEAAAGEDIARAGHIPNAIKLLQYDDGEYALRGKDLEFIEWLRKHDCIIESTKVIKEGTKIRFIEGPLCELDGKVIKVNKSRRQVQIELNNANGILSTIWCAIEYIEPQQGAAE